MIRQVLVKYNRFVNLTKLIVVKMPSQGVYFAKVNSKRFRKMQLSGKKRTHR